MQLMAAAAPRWLVIMIIIVIMAIMVILINIMMVMAVMVVMVMVMVMAMLHPSLSLRLVTNDWKREEGGIRPQRNRQPISVLKELCLEMKMTMIMTIIETI